MPEGHFLAYEIGPEAISLKLNIRTVLSFLLLSVAPFCATANIMLANNTCDLEKNVAVRRYTLPYYLGKKNSLRFFAGLYYIIYVSIVVMVIARILSPLSLLILLTLIPVQKNIRTFLAKQDKADTFLTAIRNFIIIMGAHTILIFFGRLLP